MGVLKSIKSDKKVRKMRIKAVIKEGKDGVSDLHKINFNEKGVVLDGVQLRGVTTYTVNGDKDGIRIFVTMDADYNGKQAEVSFAFSDEEEKDVK